MALLESSDPLIFKNVRVCVGNESCLLVAHLGINDVYKTIVKSEEEGIVVERWVTESGVTTGKEGSPHYNHVLEPIAFVLRELKNGIIESFEWEHEPFTLQELLDNVRMLKSLFKGIRFNVKKLVLNHNIHDKFEAEIVQMCDKKYLKAVDKRSIAHYAVSADPQFVLDFFYPNYLNGITMRFSRIFLKWESFDDFNNLIPTLMSEKPGVFLIFRAPHEHPQKMFNRRLGNIQKFPNKLVKRELFGPLILRHNLSSCGYWVTVVRRSDEKAIKTESCGLGEFCPNCTGSFEYIYFYDMPRRVIEEPEWLNVFRSFLIEYEREIQFSRLTKLVEKTPPMRVRRAVKGFEAPKVNLLVNPSPCVSKKRTFLIWTLITTLITAAFYFFYPDLLNPYLLSIPALIIPLIRVSLLTRNGHFLITLLLGRFFYSALIAMPFLYFFPDLLTSKLFMFCVILFPWLKIILALMFLFYGYRTLIVR